MQSRTLTATVPQDVGAQGSRGKEDFFWTYTEEPHKTRRQAIIKAHPDVHPYFSSLLSMAYR